MWLFWLLVFGAILASVSLFAFPPAIPVVAIVVVVLCAIMAPIALTAAKNKATAGDDGVTRNWRGEINDLGYLDEESKMPRTQRAVFFGTPQWEQYTREKRLAAGRDRSGANGAGGG